MGILGQIFSGGTAAIVDSVGKAADSLFTSKEEELQMDLENRKLDLEEAKLADRSAERQVEINKIEAAHPSLWVAGGRPFVMWISGCAMAYHFLFRPIVGPFFAHYLGVELYDIDWQELSVILLALLGIGAQRSFDKVKGVDTRRINK